MIKITFPFEIRFVAPAPDNSFWFITSDGLNLYNIGGDGRYKFISSAPNNMYLSFVFKHPRFFVPVGVKDKKSDSKIFTFDSELFDIKSEGLEYSSDFCSGDELWPCKGSDEDHKDDPDWAIALTMGDNFWSYDSSAVWRAACSWPLLAWRRNLKICEQCLDPFSSVSPPGVTSAISRSNGIVFANLSTDKSVVIHEPTSATQICMSSRENKVLVTNGKDLYIFENLIEAE